MAAIAFLLLLIPNSFAREALLEMVQRSQVPAHVKDVWESQVRKFEIRSQPHDVTLPGTAWPIDWHLSPPSRNAIGHVDLGTGQITLYPPFTKLTDAEQRLALIHYSLHGVRALGVSRFSEPLMQNLAQLVIGNLNAHSPSEREPTRLALRQWFTKRIRVDHQGGMSFLEPETTLNPPWPLHE